MKDVFAAFQQDVFRPIVTLLIPGGLSAAPWIVGVVWKYPNVGKLMGANSTQTALVVALIMIALGLVCEDIGARVEKILDERADKKTEGKFFKIWFAYLRTAFVADPVGRRYLRTLVTRLKFELGCLAACPILAAGVIWLWWLAIPCERALVLLAASFIAALYFLSEAMRTQEALAETREELMKDVRVVSERSDFTPKLQMAEEVK